MSLISAGSISLDSTFKTSARYLPVQQYKILLSDTFSHTVAENKNYEGRKQKLRWGKSRFKFFIP